MSSLVGCKPMVVASVTLSLPAQLTRKKTVFCATPGAVTTTMVSDQSAGRTALAISAMMVLFATSLTLMAVVQDLRISATTVKSGDFCGILNAVRTSTTLDVAYAHLTAQVA